MLHLELTLVRNGNPHILAAGVSYFVSGLRSILIADAACDVQENSFSNEFKFFVQQRSSSSLSMQVLMDQFFAVTSPVLKFLPKLTLNRLFNQGSVLKHVLIIINLITWNKFDQAVRNLVNVFNLRLLLDFLKPVLKKHPLQLYGLDS
jgi:hypothetical protein